MQFLSFIVTITILVCVVRCDSCIRGALQKRNYTIVQSKSYSLSVTYTCREITKDCPKGVVEKVIRGKPDKRTNGHYFYPITNTDSYQLKSTANILFYVSTEARNCLLTDFIDLPTNINCKYSEGPCYDFNMQSYVYWNYTQYQKPIYNILYKGTVDEWTIRNETPVLKLIQIEIDNKIIVLPLMKRQTLCNQSVWMTDVDDVYIYEAETNSAFTETKVMFDDLDPTVNEMFYKEENVMESIPPSMSTENKTSAEHLDQSLNSLHKRLCFLYLLIVLLIVFFLVKFFCGIITNWCILRSSNASDIGICVRSFSHNLTLQQMILRKVDPANNVLYVNNKNNVNEAIYEVNDIYNDI